jgi:hypothetical protein
MTNTFRAQAEAFEPLIEPIRDTVKKLRPIPLAIRIPDLMKEVEGGVKEVYSTIYVLMMTVDISVSVVDEAKSNGKLSESLSLYLEGMKPIDKTFEGVLIFENIAPLSSEEKEKLFRDIQEMKELD